MSFKTGTFCRFLLGQFSFSMKIKCLVIFFIAITNLTWGQNLYTWNSESYEELYMLNVQGSDCNQNIAPCANTYISDNFVGISQMAIDPDTNVYGLESGNFGSRIYKYDHSSNTSSLWYEYNVTDLNGLFTEDGNIFYSISFPYVGNILYKTDVANDETVALGSVGFDHPVGDIILFDGNIYTVDHNTATNTWGIAVLDLDNPMNSYHLITVATGGPIWGLTASDRCYTLIGIIGDNHNYELVYINLLDGAITPLCHAVDFYSLTSLNEFETPTICNVHIDLDCDDSSGAINADFNSTEINCLSSTAPVSDTDIGMLYDNVITEMSIQLTGFIPDAPWEFLTMTGPATNINVSGAGTDMITFSNAGVATSTDFKDALQLILYNNNTSNPTSGQRTVTVQFTTEAGTMSNIATAFIDVIELPFVAIDLGDDLQVCDGESATFNAGHPGAEFEWSTGDITQTITVDESGEYMVTVSDGINCPGSDTVELDILPVITISLTGDTEICSNEPANLLINTDTPFPLTIDISTTPGNPFTFPDVDDMYPFIDLPTQTTTYTITSVIPSQNACINITDSVQVVEVHPAYNQSADVEICDGDSIWLGFYWETEAGVYENEFNTISGCDSVVTTSITLLPAIHIAHQATTCDPASAGVFTTYLNNPSGCDTVVTTTVTLLPSDTTQINLLSCVHSDVGITTQTFVNQNGCDSLVITMTSYIPPTDTTGIFLTTCDSASLGVIYDTLTRIDGCDSLIITTTSMAPSDTTYLHGVSCDAAIIGISQALYNNIMGCDSLVITTIVADVPDTTYLFLTSCDSSSLGVFAIHYTTAQQCDSLVITTITYSAQDSTFIMSGSCDPANVGVWQYALTGLDGCDSIVTETIILLPSDATAIHSTTCNPAEAGIFINTLMNQFGCDSIVTETVNLLPTDQTFLTGTTCKPSEAGMFITTHLNQFGCDSIVTFTVSLIPTDTTLLFLKTCDPESSGVVYYPLAGSDGCDSLVIETTSLFPLPQLNLIVTSEFNGYGISCFGEHDGSIDAMATGEAPFQYSWSTGDTTQGITGLGAGDYNVLITDANGCQASGSIELNHPEAFTIGFDVSQPDCFTNEAGTIMVLQSGGILPVRYSKDGINYQSSPIFNDLSAGSYTITAIDANECEAKEIIMINVSVDINVDLGDDQVILPGDTSTIDALVNVPYDSLASIIWTGLMNPNCPTCLTQFVAPIITTAYTVSVSNAQGCSDLDSMIVFVERNINIYVPNVFSPNGDGINDHLLISAGAYIEEIESFTIFDRWGNMVYLNENFQPNDPSVAWDGKRKGLTLNPGVFAYKMIAKFADGRSEIIYGDVTLLR